MSGTIDINTIMKELGARRPVFHSEADFQFELAWQIKQYFTDYQIRLEYPVIAKEDRKEYIDLVVITDKNEWIPIELKYKTKKETYNLSKDNSELEDIELADQSATDYGRYWFWRDVCRIEDLFKNGYAKKNWTEGYAIILTNDKNYWDKDGAGTSWENFSLKDKTVKEEDVVLEWIKTPRMRSENYMKLKGNKPELTIKNNYCLNWNDYSNYGSELKYLVLSCGKTND